ncbi:hypothetical protein MASR1M60_21590 [Rhodocyclaceae bacterium]
MIRLVCATPHAEAAFWTNTLLGRTLNFYRQYAAQFELRLFPENRRGLPAVYNQAIEEVRRTPRILVFIHDDIHFFDLFWPQSIAAGLDAFDLIGTLGCKRHYPRQLSWVHVWQGDKVGNPRREDVSGAVGHFAHGEVEGAIPLAPLRPDHLAPFGGSVYMSYFGPPGQAVVLLDGMLLACRSETLWQHHLRFDERFDFHFYDMDFCRQCEQKGLRMGTWTISVLHGSHGSYGEAFYQAYPTYLAKWPEPT